MDKKFTAFLVTELNFKNRKLAPIDLLLAAAPILFGLMLRKSVIGYYAIGFPVFEQMAGYMKPVTMVFDLLLAVLGGMFVYKLTGRKLRGLLAYALLFLLPPLCAQSAMWGMGDSIYVFLALLSLYLLYGGKGNASLIFYGLSLFLSRYAFFLLPVFAAAYLQKKNRLLFWIFPLCGAWFRSGIVHRGGNLPIPVFEMERMVQRLRPEVLLSYNYPNFYQIVGADKFVAEYGMAAKFLAAALMAGLAVYLYAAGRDVKEHLAELGVFCCMLLPFLMPQMDERAGLLADVLAVVLAFKVPQLFYVAVLQNVLSYIAYSAYFRQESALPLSLAAVLSFGLVLIMAAYALGGRFLSIRSIPAQEAKSGKEVQK